MLWRAWTASRRVGRGSVSSRLYDHASILKLIETRWGLQPLALRDAQANDLRDGLKNVNCGEPLGPRATNGWSVIVRTVSRSRILLNCAGLLEDRLYARILPQLFVLLAVGQEDYLRSIRVARLRPPGD